MDSFYDLNLDWGGGGKGEDKVPKTKAFLPTRSFSSGQRCTVKSSYNTNVAGLKNTIDYITRDDACSEEKEDRLFTGDGKDINIEPIDGEKRYHRIIISPENADDLNNIKETTKRIMEQIEKKTGYDLQWCAAVHDKDGNEKADHKHVHVVVRGIDRNGKEVFFDPSFIKEEIRKIASNQLTRELGLRSLKDMKKAREKEITAERFTSIDRKIYGIVKNNMTESMNIKTPKNKNGKKDLSVEARLEALVKIGLARQTLEGFQLSKKWKEDLQAIQNNKDIIKRIHRGVQDVSNEKLYVHDGTYKVTGKIVKVGADNELYDSKFAVLKDSDNNLHYMTGKNIQNVKEGMDITVDRNHVSYHRAAEKTKESGIER